ncbi:hypothetical protein HNQ91_003422 [Filimonas zeae]|uniref:MrfA-like Zn-binding domain-containing protein n=1 Tax=Filimonas zeae TaxID=1737353 RepID=A0A917J087_9BACT|nr:DUF1998 domain-containing protein [Filimonas zeae]MDR6340357.1 hypothetical protein [Filimonas zeae]GGH72357.1 hypothetical protein GCM10011379_32690 [Filimonas zeae]
MEIQQQQQYNQAISRYKLLSTNAGVGAVITTAFGNYILISDITHWPFIKASNARIKEMVNSGAIIPENWYIEAKRDLSNNIGIDLVDDERFIKFLKIEKNLPNLLCLAAIPQLTLNESFNSLNKKSNPVIKKLADKGNEKKAEDFAIPATHFPKWFRNDKGTFKPYHEWKRDWEKRKYDLKFFAPPRDANSHYSHKIKVTNKSKIAEEINACKILSQVNLLLICENGHLSDIPWPKFLRWKNEQKKSHGNEKTTKLFTDIEDCCSHPVLKWSESKNKSEGYASIFIECLNCHTGSGDASNPKVNLEGINNLEPNCPGHKPWEISLDKEDKNSIPYDSNCYDTAGHRTRMKVALATGNNVYFANTFSSIYIPVTLLKGITPEIERLLKICEIKFEASPDPNKRKSDWAERRIDREFIGEYYPNASNPEDIIRDLKAVFVDGILLSEGQENDDLQEIYKKEEYDVFCNNSSYNSKGLNFSDIELDGGLENLFQKITKVEELKITSVQLDFNRVKPKERIVVSGNVIDSGSKNIFSNAPDDVFIMPAVENFGEGIFFEFNKYAIEKWTNEHISTLSDRIRRLMPASGGFNGNSIRYKIQRNGARLLLIHTYTHLIMRELEFSCGYPTASLKERLYISPDMSGALIYTAEGAEGSMGGLIWQAQAERIKVLIQKAMKRAMDCSSDPLCWEDEGQGLFNLNLSACFSCTLVSETACEERNLALDRRMLVDPEFGYFKHLV